MQRCRVRAADMFVSKRNVLRTPGQFPSPPTNPIDTSWLMGSGKAVSMSTSKRHSDGRGPDPKGSQQKAGYCIHCAAASKMLLLLSPSRGQQIAINMLAAGIPTPGQDDLGPYTAPLCARIVGRSDKPCLPTDAPCCTHGTSASPASHCPCSAFKLRQLLLSPAPLEPVGHTM